MTSLWLYEPFAYSNTYPNGPVTIASISSGIQGDVSVNNTGLSNTVFFRSSQGLNISAPSTQFYVVQDACGNTYSNVVNVFPGRFTLPNGYSSNIYINEPVSIELDTSGAMTNIYSTATVPPGLSLNSLDGNAGFRWALSGTPSLQSPATAYPIFGINTSNGNSVSVTAGGTPNITLKVNPERIQLFPSLSAVQFTGLQQNVAITPYSITPSSNVSAGTFFYSWDRVIDGLYFSDISGTPKSAPFFPTDPSLTIVLRGTPTSNGLIQASQSTQTTLYASRTTDFLRSSNIAFSYNFVETILFSLPGPIQLYSNAPVSSLTTIPTFRATTYFYNTNPTIAQLFSPNLRSDLSLNFASQIASLTGTPNGPFPSGAYNFTLFASNTNGVTATSPTVQMSVSGDVVTFSSSPSPTPYKFVVSRDLSNALVGSYPSNIQFVASARSGQPVNYSMTGLENTGIFINSSGVLYGTPSNIIGTTTATVRATANLTGAFSTQTFQASVSGDIFTFSDISLATVQNIEITPVQVTATTVSGRPVTTFSSTNLPTGLFISANGLISGTPTSTANTFTITGNTGYASGSRTYTISNTPDALLYYPTSIQSRIPLPIDGSRNIPVFAISYSGLSPSNFSISSNANLYGITIDPSNGSITTRLKNSIPPNIVFPESETFQVDCCLNGIDLSSTLVFSNTNIYYPTTFISRRYGPSTYSLYLVTNPEQSNVYYTNIFAPAGEISSYGRRYVNPFDYTVLATITTPTTAGIVRITSNINTVSAMSVTTSAIGQQILSSVVNKPGTSKWFAFGVNQATQAGMITSTDDGQTWGAFGALPTFVPRNLNCNFPGYTSGGLYNPYLTYGSTVVYASNTLVLGGYSDASLGIASIQYSLDDGISWSNASTSFTDTAQIVYDSCSTIIAVGSTLYRSGSVKGSIDAQTIILSKDFGRTWSNVGGSSPGFGYRGDSVAYGSNVWIATGVEYGQNPTGSIGYYRSLRYSRDGSNWSRFYLTPTPSNDPVSAYSSTLPIEPPIGVGPIVFDTRKWYIYVSNSTLALGPLRWIVYSHPASGDITSGWTSNQIDLSSGAVYGGLSEAVAISSNGFPLASELQFEGIGASPVFTNTQTSYLLYQYMPFEVTISTISPSYLYVNDSTLPRGIKFNPLTGKLSGTPVLLGTYTVNVFAEANDVTTVLTLTLEIRVASVVRQLGNGASAYTSYLRNYTVVNAAQRGVNNEVFSEDFTGTFTRPVPGDVQTASNACS